MEVYKVRVSKDYLSFCSAHFIIYNDTQCERLHGHNYRVATEIEGDLDENFLVFDFIALKGILLEICAELDHRMLVPQRSPCFQIDVEEKRVRMAYEDREWIFPRDDCCLLPIENTTAELLARWFHGRIVDELRSRVASESGKGGRLRHVRVEIEESPGQNASYEVSPVEM